MAKGSSVIDKGKKKNQEKSENAETRLACRLKATEVCPSYFPSVFSKVNNVEHGCKGRAANMNEHMKVEITTAKVEAKIKGPYFCD